MSDSREKTLAQIREVQKILRQAEQSTAYYGDASDPAENLGPWERAGKAILDLSRNQDAATVLAEHGIRFHNGWLHGPDGVSISSSQLNPMTVTPDLPRTVTVHGRYGWPDFRLEADVVQTRSGQFIPVIKRDGEIQHAPGNRYFSYESSAEAWKMAHILLRDEVADNRYKVKAAPSTAAVVDPQTVSEVLGKDRKLKPVERLRDQIITVDASPGRGTEPPQTLQPVEPRTSAAAFPGSSGAEARLQDADQQIAPKASWVTTALDAIARNNTPTRAPWTGLQQALSGRGAAGVTADIDKRAEGAARIAVDALRKIETGPAAGILRRMRAEAAVDPKGMTGVISRMRPGGKFETIRNELNTLFAENREFASAYNEAKAAVATYLTTRDELAQNDTIHGRSSAGVNRKLSAMDKVIAERADKVPGPMAGRSLVEDLGEGSMAVAKVLIEHVRQASGGSTPGPDADASAASAPGIAPSI